MSLAVLMTGQGCGYTRPGRPLALPPIRSLPASSRSHVVVIVMENREYSEVIGNRSAPYINRLARSGALATSYFAISHPSLPNYLALTGGQTFGITSDCTACVAWGPDLTDELDAAGRSWRAYMEDLPGPCSKASTAGGYAKKHDPFLYYPSVAGSPRRCDRVVPLSALRDDLVAGRVPDFVWISPNLCDDGHDCSLSVADQFLSHLVPALMAELGPHGFLAVTWDEGSSDRGCCGVAQGGQVATILAGPRVRAGAAGGGKLDHYSLLRTIEDAFGVAHLGEAGCPCTHPLDSLFVAPARARLA